MNNKSFQKHMHTKGAALLIFVLFFLAVSLSFILTIGQGVYTAVANYTMLETGKKSFYAAEAGIEDAVYRHIQGMSYSNTENFEVSGTSVSIERVTNGDTYEITAQGLNDAAVRRSATNLVIGGGVSFGFGIQSGNGGFVLANSAKVYGNVFSNGTVSGSGNYIYGDVISAGASGALTNIHATGSAWAHTITSSTIDGDAYYQTITGSLVSGSSCTSNIHCHPSSPDQATTSMPIADELIDEWKATAEAGGVIPLASCSGGVASGTYTINSNRTIGPIKIPCNFTVSGNSTVLNLTGPVWVVGDISANNGPTIQVDSSLPNTSVAVIADNPSNRTTRSKIRIQNSTGFMGAAGDSYVLMVSMNNSASTGGSEEAIELSNSTPGSEREVIYYAPYGEIEAGNSILLRGATAYRIRLSNTASVYYETGMFDPLFSGSGGGYTVESWREI